MDNQSYIGLVLWCLMLLSTIFQLYRGGKFICVEETIVHGEYRRPASTH